MCVPGDSANVNEMSADPNVTSVGGTEFTSNYDDAGNDVGFVPEQVWDEPPSNGAAGGGASAVFPKPAYQEGVTPADDARDVPDVAMIASPDMPGVEIFADQNGNATPTQIGGTSLAAPLWAGIAELIAQETGNWLGNMNTRIYQLGPFEDALNVGLRDVTSGSNFYTFVTGFSAAPLYDQASGWGSADIGTFVAAYQSPAQANLVIRPPGVLHFGREAFAHGGAVSQTRVIALHNPSNRQQYAPIWLEGFRRTLPSQPGAQGINRLPL